MALRFYDPSRAIELPHPPIPISVLLIAERAICEAWGRLQAIPATQFNLLTASENALTHKLREILFDEVFDHGVVDGFDAQLFTTVTRDSKVASYDGTNIDKMPDLLISLYGRRVFKRSQDGLFVECKPVDANHPAGGDYCDKGVVRFTRGEYAWAMTSALMVGYARPGYTIPSKLPDALRARLETQTQSFPEPCNYSSAGPLHEVVQISRHGRPICYVENGMNVPPIELRHLWLRRG